MPTNVSAVADSFSTPNYLGELFLVGQNQTPFLNMAGGLTGGGRQVNAFQFPVSQEWNLDAGAQPAITETGSQTAPTPRSYVRGQTYNTVQIFHKAVTVSYVKQSQVGAMSGINVEGTNVVRDEKTFQINANLKQIAKDVEYTFLNGVYQAASDAATAAKTRGMLAVISTNAVAAGSTALTETHINTLVKTMADNGCPFSQPVMFAGSAQIQKITAIYKASDAYMSSDITVGGVAVKRILTDFCEMGVVWAPAMPAGSVVVVDMAYIAPVFLAVPGKGFLFYEELAKTGAAEKGQIYGQIGLDHGVEMFHGKITGLT
jgi:hypothetical protein